MRSTFDRRPAGETIGPPSPVITPLGSPPPTPSALDCTIPTNWDNPECAVFLSTITADQKHQMLLAYVRRYFGRDDIGSLTDEQYMMILRLPKDPLTDPNNSINTLNRLTGRTPTTPAPAPAPVPQPIQPVTPVSTPVATSATTSNGFLWGLLIGAGVAWIATRSKSSASTHQ